MNRNELKDFLDLKYEQYNRTEFISSDPVSIPHLFSKKEDIEISAFLASTIAWGQRTTIINNALHLMNLMDNSPHDFILHFNKYDLKNFTKFVHRTFNGDDCKYFIKTLRRIYKTYGSMENVFMTGYEKDKTIRSAIIGFREVFFMNTHESRTEKHVSGPVKNSSCKRLNLFLRWMIRNDNRGVDFGIWKNFSPSSLMCPLDVHSGNVSRKLGLLGREQSDWKAVEELTANLRILDPADPVKYDFALFGLGVFEKF